LLESIINELCLKRIGRKPDLDAPKGYNDLIQWLKLHDQRPEHITCCDKWAVRDWVAQLAGPEVLIPARRGLSSMPLPLVAKCTHDSGSARFVRTRDDLSIAAVKLSQRLVQTYGAEKGEWAYQFVKPQVIAEELLTGPAVDYKFHCSGGKARWAQVIWGRGKGKPREAIFEHCPMQAIHPGPHAWEKLTELAEKLAMGWRYVRVDLYWTGKPWFGELTFWPRAGCYNSPDERTFGEMLDLDLSQKRERIVQ
jgi:hypothetical protein